MGLNSDPGAVSQHLVRRRIIHIKNVLSAVEQQLPVLSKEYIRDVNAELVRIEAAKVFKKIKV